MKCHVYRSDSKDGFYLYLDKKSELLELPEELLKMLGKHTKVMELDLSKRKKLAQQDIEKVKTNLKEKGYHVQLPTEIGNIVIDYKT